MDLTKPTRLNLAKPSQAELGDTIIGIRNKKLIKTQTFYWSNSVSSNVIGQWNIKEIYEIKVCKIRSNICHIKSKLII